MKRTGTIITLLVITTAAIAGIYYIYSKGQEDPTIYTTEQPTTQTIIREAVATGNLVPAQEINIKPNISGVIEKIHVVAGSYIKAGDLVAEIKVVPNVSSLTTAKNNISAAKNDLETARLARDNQKLQYERQKVLYTKGVISANEFDLAQNQYNNASQRYKQEQVNVQGANQSYDIARTGTTAGLGNYANTSIRATVSGKVLDVPVKVGNQVIEANNFNEGTSIAVIANVDNMVFEGKIDESEVGKIKIGLPLEITVGAYGNKKYSAILDYIAPKGILENGAIQFAIKGTIQSNDTEQMLSGLSANASIILERSENVLAIKEALVQYEPKTNKPFVEIEKDDQEYVKKYVTLGLSDGIYVEIKKGIKKNDRVKVWNPLSIPTN